MRVEVTLQGQSEKQAPEEARRLHPGLLYHQWRTKQALQRAPVDTPPNKPVTDVVREVIAEDVKIQDEALEVYRSSIRSVLSENGDGTVTLAGTDHTFNLTDRMFDADGNEVTVREMLDDLQMKDQELEVFTSCSIR